MNLLVPLQQGTVGDLSEAVRRTIADIIAFLPRLVGALLILLIGWILGRIAARIVTRLVDVSRVDDMVLDTPLGRMLGGTERAVSRSFGRLAAWFVYALAILAAADVLAIQLLSAWINTAVTYLPAFVAGLLIIVVGFVVADFVADAIRRTEAATRTGYTHVFADAVRIFLYFTVLIIGLDTMGVDVSIIYTLIQPLAWGLAIALGLAIGIAFGWGGKDYVASNLGRWFGRAREEAGSSNSGSPGPGSTGSGSSGPGGTGSDTTGSGTGSMDDTEGPTG